MEKRYLGYLVISAILVFLFFFVRGRNEKMGVKEDFSSNLKAFAGDYPPLGLSMNVDEIKINYDSLYTYLINLNLSDSRDIELLLKDAFIRDQQPRDSLQRYRRNENETKIDYFSKQMSISDEINRRIVKYVFSKIGWPDTREFEPEAKEAIWYVLCHCNDKNTLLFSKEYIEKAFKDSIISNQSYAMLYDRINVKLHKKQIYGTYPSFDENRRKIIIPEISISLDSINYQRHLIGLSKL